MELLDRYLQAVRKHLQWQRQEDIIAELRANLEAQLDDKQTELGRPLTPAEAEDWIGRLGSPVQMAAQYQPQQYLIGPAIYPVYLYVLRLASMWALIIYAIISTVTIVLNFPGPHAVLDMALHLPIVLIQVAAWVTVVFAVVEYVAVRFPDKCPPIAGFYAKWSPANLPALERPASGGRKPRSYPQAVVEVIFGFIVLAWLLVVPQHPYLMFGPGVAYLHASPFHLAPVWMTFYWWLVAVNAIQLAWHCVDLMRGTWQQPGRVLHIVSKAFSLIAALVLVNAPDHVYVLLKHPETELGRYGQTLGSLNHGVHSVSLLICAIIALQLAWEVGRAVLEAYRRRSVAR